MKPFRPPPPPERPDFPPRRGPAIWAAIIVLGAALALVIIRAAMRGEL